VSRIDGVRIGLIELSTSVGLSIEAPLAVPAGVTPVLSRLRFSGGVHADDLEAMVREPALEDAATLLADADVRALAFACTTGSLLHGRGYDIELVARLEAATDRPATTTATALIAALRAVGARRLVVGTPYAAELNSREKDFLEAEGFEVLAIAGLGIERDDDIVRVPGDELDSLAARVWRDGADAVFLSCTNLLTLGHLDALERRFGAPVLSSNAVTVWHVLRLAGVVPAQQGVGSLLAGRLTTPTRPTTGDAVHVR
jgi:maleate isomerase